MSPVQHAGIPDAFWRDPVERAKTDPAAFGELYDRYSPRIYRFVRSRIHDDGLAEDVTADVFLSVWQAIDRLPRQQRAAMLLKFSDDLTMEDIGAVLGKSPAAAKLLIYRAVQRLRLELARDLVASAS